MCSIESTWVPLLTYVPLKVHVLHCLRFMTAACYFAFQNRRCEILNDERIYDPRYRSENLN